MRQHGLRAFLMVGVLAAIVLPVSVTGAASPLREQSVLDKLKQPANAVTRTGANGLVVKSKTDEEGKITTKDAYKVPLTIKAQVRTDRNNVRLYYGKQGVVILGWEINPGELRHQNPVNGQIQSAHGKGDIKKDTWMTVEWTIDEKHSRVTVDGVERCNFEGDYAGFSGVVGVGTNKSTITVKSLAVVSLLRDSDTVRVDDDGNAVSIDVEVPTKPAAPRDSAAGPGATLPKKPVDPDAIERPEYRVRAKSYEKIVSSITSMVVRVGEDGEQMGFTSDIIATVNEESRSEKTAGAGFYRADGDHQMKSSFQEAVRAVRLRYPFWEPGHIDFSFGEKFTSHGGPSAGTPFAMLILSVLEDFDLDTKCAVTGDITVNWKVRSVGGVTAKLRGATLDRCNLAVIPADNAIPFADMAILYGPSSMYKIQVFSVVTLQDAVAVARKDRGAKLVEAIKHFADLQTKLERDEKATLQNPATAQVLKRILDLAPNHLSAKNLLDRVNGKAPTTLSQSATLYRLSVIFYPYVRLLNRDKDITRETLPAHVTPLARKRLAELKPIAAPELLPLIKETGLTIEAMEGFVTKNASAATLKNRWERLAAINATTFGDPTLVEKLVREGF